VEIRPSKTEGASRNRVCRVGHVVLTIFLPQAPSLVFSTLEGAKCVSESYIRYFMIDIGVSQSLVDEICLAFLFQEFFNGFSGA
jgi:hypothetical protein